MTTFLVGCLAAVYVATPGSSSLTMVRDRIRADRASGKIGTDERVEVVLEDGLYALSSPLALDKRDSGTTWRASNRLKAVLSGAVEPVGWHPVASDAIRARLQPQVRDHVLEADVPGNGPIPSFASAGLYPNWGTGDFPMLLFLGKRRLPCARWPNGDTYVRTGKSWEKKGEGHEKAGFFVCEDSSRLVSLAKETDLWTFGMWNWEWADYRMPVTRIVPDERVVEVDGRLDMFGFLANRPYFLFNALCEIDEPGEWALDRKSRKVYYLPTAGDDERPVFAATAELLVVNGAEDIVFDGLGFVHSRVRAVTFRDCRNVRLQASAIAHTGGAGVKVDGGRSCRVEGCDLLDIGEGGIELFGGDRATLLPGGHVAENNHIHHYGQYTFNYRAGIRLEGVENAAIHNLVHHARHNGICFDGNDHRIAYNVIHDTCSYNDDAGAIYTCARDFTKRGTVIEYNLVHMTGKPKNPRHCDAIYIDDFTSGTVVRGNVICRATRGIHVGGGQDNLVERNVIVNCLMSIHLDSRVGWPGARKSGILAPLTGNRELYSSGLWRSRYPNMLRIFEFDDFLDRIAAQFNVFSNNVAAGCSAFVKEDWKRVSSTTIVTNCLECAGDPGFSDFENLDWNLKPGPTRDLVGVLPIGRMGLYESETRASPAVRFGKGVTHPRPVGQFEYMPAEASIHFNFQGKLPDGVTSVATNCVGCNVPSWSRGKRVVCAVGVIGDEWKTFGCSFVPTADVTVSFDLMGARGEKTLYDDIRVDGTDFSDGGFEKGEGWCLPKPDFADIRAPYCNQRPPFGIISENEAGCEPIEGRFMGCSNDMLVLSREIRLKRGVPVRLSFKARALPCR